MAALVLDSDDDSDVLLEADDASHSASFSGGSQRSTRRASPSTTEPSRRNKRRRTNSDSGDELCADHETRTAPSMTGAHAIEMHPIDPGSYCTKPEVVCQRLDNVDRGNKNPRVIGNAELGSQDLNHRLSKGAAKKRGHISSSEDVETTSPATLQANETLLVAKPDESIMLLPEGSGSTRGPGLPAKRARGRPRKHNVTDDDQLPEMEHQYRGPVVKAGLLDNTEENNMVVTERSSIHDDFDQVTERPNLDMQARESRCLQKDAAESRLGGTVQVPLNKAIVAMDNAESNETRPDDASHGGRTARDGERIVAANSGKLVYKVGLSKRVQIEPLLRITKR